MIELGLSPIRGSDENAVDGGDIQLDQQAPDLALSEVAARNRFHDTKDADLGGDLHAGCESPQEEAKPVRNGEQCNGRYAVGTNVHQPVQKAIV